MTNLLRYNIRRLIRFVFKRGFEMILRAPVQVYQTRLYKSTVHAAIAAGFNRQQYAEFLLAAQNAHIAKNKTFLWCADNVKSAMHWRTTGAKNVWAKIHNSM